MNIRSIAQIVSAPTRRPVAPLPLRMAGNYNPWPYPPHWAEQRGSPQLPWFWYEMPQPQSRDRLGAPPLPNFGSAVQPGGNPGLEGDLFIGADRAPRTGGWVYGLHPWYPEPPTSSYTGRPLPSRRA